MVVMSAALAPEFFRSIMMSLSGRMLPSTSFTATPSSSSFAAASSVGFSNPRMTWDSDVPAAEPWIPASPSFPTMADMSSNSCPASFAVGAR